MIGRERRVTRRRGLLALVAFAMACGSSYDGPSAPATGNTGGGGGGPVGSVSVGNGIQFVSRHNGTMNPAVDTVAVGSAVTWTWSGTLPHSVRSVGATSFASSDTRTGSGTYSVTFTQPGTYHYDCAVHGAAMSGTIVVPGSGIVTSVEVDPIGDTFHNTGGKQWDLNAFTVSRDTGGVTAKLDFTADVLSPMSGDTTAIIGFVEFDLDQNHATGGESVVDHFRLDGGTATLGVDATVDMSQFAADSTVAVYDGLAHVTGRIKPAFEGRSITIRVPRAMLQDDDGFLNAATIIGAIHRPTDFAPQTGHLVLGAPPLTAVAARPASPLRLHMPRTWRQP